MAEIDVLNKLDDVMDKLDDALDKIADNKEQIEAQRSVQKYCAHCLGDGTKGGPGGEPGGNCPDCGGDGFTPFGRITLTTEE